MTTLHYRLADLAAEAPPGGPAPDLWDRGRRYARRRRVGTVVVVGVVVLLLAGVAGAGWLRTPHDVAPARPDANARAGLPDRLYLPSPWLPGTDETGPIGPVVALVPGPRGSDGTGIAGVSRSGAYTFLDLPDRADEAEGEVAVSPDGRWVAYWSTGEVSDGPNTSTGAAPVVGVAVYDSVTGDVLRHEVPSAHGLMPGELVWGGTTLWSDWLPFAKAGSGGHAEAPLDDENGLAWDLADGTRRAFTPRSMPQVYDGTSSDGALVTVDDRRLTTSTIAEPRSPGAQFDRRVESRAFVSPDGGRVAVLEDTDDPGVASNQAEPLAVATPGADGLSTVRVPGGRVDVVLGWRDQDHVVVQRYRQADGAYLSVDVRTGDSEQLLDLPPENWSPGVLVPQDVWQAPQFAAPAPPDPMSPRTRATLVGTGAAAVVLGGVALVLWRRRVRP